MKPNLLKRILGLSAWRAGVSVLALASIGVYATAMELDALVSQVLSAFAVGISTMVLAAGSAIGRPRY